MMLDEVFGYRGLLQVQKAHWLPTGDVFQLIEFQFWAFLFFTVVPLPYIKSFSLVQDWGVFNLTFFSIVAVHCNGFTFNVTIEHQPSILQHRVTWQHSGRARDLIFHLCAKFSSLMVYLAILLAVCYSLWLFIAIVYSDIGKVGCSRGCQQVIHFAGLLFLWGAGSALPNDQSSPVHVANSMYCMAPQVWWLGRGTLFVVNSLSMTLCKSYCALLGIHFANSLTRRHFSCVPGAQQRVRALMLGH